MFPAQNLASIWFFLCEGHAIYSHYFAISLLLIKTILSYN